MLESISSNNIFEYKKLSKEEQQARGILGRLVGVMADSKNPTRNGRRYSAELWQKVFDNPIMQEKINNRVCFGEACHPADGREEVDPEKVAICLAEVPKMNNKGQLIGVFDVLDTPCGRILKTMLDYGANIGVSSRGSGDLFTDYDGQEAVDPDSYDCVCWDAVFVPAVKEARLKLVTESYNGKTLKQALNESLENATEDERKIMQETIDNINMELDEDVSSVKQAMQELRNYLESWYNTNIAPEYVKHVDEAGWDREVQDAWLLLVNLLTDVNDESLNIEENSDTTAVDNTKAMIEELQRILKENNDLANTITKLQEKLSVSYAKEAELQEEVNRYAKSVKRLSEEIKKVDPLRSKVNSLTENLNQNSKQLETTTNTVKKLRSQLKEQAESNKTLTEELSKKDISIRNLKKNIISLETEYSGKEKQLQESMSSLQKDMQLKSDDYSKKLANANKLVENYKKIVNKAVDKYIDSQARIIGVSKQEIKNKLSESYSFDEIDSVCDSLREYKLNISKLPFRTSDMLTENVRLKATPSKNEAILPANSGDEVDEQLLNLAGL